MAFHTTLLRLARPAFLAVLVVASVWRTGREAAAVGTGFSLPAETFTPQAQLAPLQQELARENFTDAAARLDLLLRDHADELMAVDGGVLSFSAWLPTLPAAARAGLTGACRQRFDDAAQERLEAVTQSPTATPEQFYAVARRYPFSAVASTALVAAADRAVLLGDVSAAAAYYHLARQSGWTPDAGQRQSIEACDRILAGSFLAAPPGQAATRPMVPGRNSIPYTGCVPFDAVWLNNPAAVGQGRFYPIAADERLFLSSPRSVMAVRATGQTVWTYVAPPAPPAARPAPPPPRSRGPEKLLPDRIDGAHRPGLYAPAVWCDVYGRPQIVVARQEGDRDKEYILRAFRATDGKPLWSSEDQPQLRDLSFAGTPAVSGRTLFAVALLVDQPAHDNATVVLAAVDTLSGELQWQATVGVFTLPRDRRGRFLAISPWDDVWEQSEPTVSGDAVYVTPNTGVAIKVGRFDGKVRWARPYTAAPANDDPGRPKGELQKLMEDRRELLRRAKEARTNGLPPPVIQPPPLDPALTERYTSTPRVCGDRVLIAPADSFGVFALDTTTGRQIWEKKDADIPTLVGATDRAAIFAGAAVTALDPASGQTRWKWEPPRGGWVSGPVVVRGNTILVPTDTALVALDAGDGTPAKGHDPSSVPSWRRVMASESLRKLIDTAGAAKSFGMPPAP